MKRIQLLILLVFTMIMLIPLAIGQDNDSVIEPTDPDMVNPEANITFPPPVYVVRDSVDIRGTVTLADMRNFFVEFRPLVLDMMDMEDETEESDDQWFPATLPRIAPVTDDILGTWNTVTLRDGLYELRLTMNTGAEEPQYFRVSPIRIENNAPPFVAEQQVIEEPQPDAEPAAEPEATATPDDTPRVIALVNSNVRAGDSIFYGIVGGLRESESATIKGVSSYNTGWFYIELDSGRSGFIHPNIVRTEGDLSNLARINPPPLPPTPIPIPTAIPAPSVPQSGANLVLRDVVIHPHPATCKVGYSITVTVLNDGSGAATSGGEIEVTDSLPDGSWKEKTRIAYGPLAAGQSQTVNGYLTPTVNYEARHNINLRVDINNQVGETNEGDNLAATAPYILAKGDCG